MRKKTTPTLSLEEREALFDELEASLSPYPSLTIREHVGEPDGPLHENESDRTQPEFGQAASEQSQKRRRT